MPNKQKSLNRAGKSGPANEKRPSGPLPGHPGYRTQSGRSGYDPIDSRTESARLTGTFLSRFFTFRLKTHNLFQLLLLGLLGLVLFMPLAIALVENAQGISFPLEAWLFLSLCGIVGAVALINFFKNRIN